MSRFRNIPASNGGVSVAAAIWMTYDFGRLHSGPSLAVMMAERQ